MNFLVKVIQGLAFVPSVVRLLEEMLGSKNGEAKKSAALSLVQTALSATDEAVDKNMVDPAKFEEGLSKVIDGVVCCLNASVWAKAH
jgi:hypothetical protein